MELGQDGLAQFDSNAEGRRGNQQKLKPAAAPVCTGY
jgi:hypothetical protein